MFENREIINTDGRLVGTLKIDGGVLKKFRYAEGSDAIPFDLLEANLAGVTRVGDWAFYVCTSLVSIKIPDSVKSIGNEAFRDCSSLASIVIPGSVTSIGEGAFYGCTSIRSVIFSKVTLLLNTSCQRSRDIVSGVFSQCTSIQTITVPALFDIKKLQAAMRGSKARNRADVIREEIVLSAQKNERKIPGSFAMAFANFILLCAEHLRNLKSDHLPALPDEIWMMILDSFHHIYIPEKKAKLGSRALLFGKTDKKALQDLNDYNHELSKYLLKP